MGALRPFWHAPTSRSMGDSPAPNRDGRASTRWAPSGPGSGMSDKTRRMSWHPDEHPVLAASGTHGML
eukprot:11673237-Alexandrium_andersonii.AAC.1